MVLSAPVAPESAVFLLGCEPLVGGAWRALSGAWGGGRRRGGVEVGIGQGKSTADVGEPRKPI
eukprot:2867644-Pyramimonas_sp.AAC.1